MTGWLPIVLAWFALSLTSEAIAQEVLLMPVPSQTIFPGQRLDDVKFTVKLFNVWESARSAYILQQDQLTGKESIRTLAAGKPIARVSIQDAEEVKKGQATKAMYKSGDIEIQGVLVPQTGGAIGQTLKARNASSGNSVNAVVLEDGTLLVIGK
jgi:flagellar basal body P-ring formation protein FlgA